MPKTTMTDGGHKIVNRQGDKPPNQVIINRKCDTPAEKTPKESKEEQAEETTE
jgi:hypothetical protein